jgi:hypothetical protein
MAVAADSMGVPAGSTEAAGPVPARAVGVGSTAEGEGVSRRPVAAASTAVEVGSAEASSTRAGFAGASSAGATRGSTASAGLVSSETSGSVPVAVPGLHLRPAGGDPAGAPGVRAAVDTSDTHVLVLLRRRQGVLPLHPRVRGRVAQGGAHARSRLMPPTGPVFCRLAVPSKARERGTPCARS